jgi:hypothetical protein
MPDDYENERPLEFTFEDKDKYKITFSVEVNSFIPAFEFDTEIHSGNRMFEILSTVTDQKIESFTRGSNTDDVNIIDKNDI